VGANHVQVSRYNLIKTLKNSTQGNYMAKPQKGPKNTKNSQK